MRKDGDPLLLEQQRFNAARMADMGLAAKVIAASLGFDDQTVRRWLRAYHAGGMDALKARLHPGPRPRLSDQQKRQLLDLIAQPPETYTADGLAGRLWTAARMAKLIQSRFGVCYHPSHVGQMMHELDYSQQLPHKRPRERSREKIDHWLAVEWPRIVQQARQTRSRIAFVDEAGFLMNPLRRKVWAPRGCTPVLEHRTRNHEKVSVIGALVAGADPQQVELLTQWHPGQSVDADAVVSFLETLREECAGNLIVVWDNLPAHRSKRVKGFLAAHHELWLEALPGYAPELNPIELVWCMSKYHRMANHGIGELEALHAASQTAVNEVAGQKQLLASCIRHAGLADALYPPGAQ